MKNLDNDIDKYRKGELTPAERHALEKRALSDPFLADALEGAAQIGPEEFSQDVKSLNKRIQVSKPVFTPLRIAAGVLILMAASWMTLNTLDETQPEKLGDAKSPEQQTGAKDSSAAGSTPNNDELLSQNREEKKVEEQKNLPKRERITESPHPTVAARDDDAKQSQPVETSEQADETVRTTDEVQQGELAQARDTIATPVTAPLATQGYAKSEQESKDKASDLERKQADMILSQDRRTRRAAAAAGAVKEDAITSQTVVTGKVTAADDGIALPGVNVVEKGTTNGSVTDVNGNYRLDLSKESGTLVFSFIGLQTQEAAVLGRTVDVKMNEDASQLSEVVVTGYARSSSASEPVVKLAEPIGGRRAYDRYLESNVRYSQQALDNNVKGRVIIQFTVGSNGALDEFAVNRSLGYGCDEELIRLVREGPRWNPSTENNTPTSSTVRVKMRFDASRGK